MIRRKRAPRAGAEKPLVSKRGSSPTVREGLVPFTIEFTLTTIYEEAEEGGYIGYVAELRSKYSRRNFGGSTLELERGHSTNSGSQPRRIRKAVLARFESDSGTTSPARSLANEKGRPPSSHRIPRLRLRARRQKSYGLSQSCKRTCL